MACLDTSVILDLLGRGGRRKQLAAEAKLRQLEHDRPHSVARFVLAELLIGVEFSANPDRERAQLDPLLARLQILEFDARSMRLYARIFVHLRSLGHLPGVMDMLIASVSLSHGQRLVTRNPPHYDHVPGLRVESY
jgi:predicted nucleic acid-binding protein